MVQTIKCYFPCLGISLPLNVRNIICVSRNVCLSIACIECIQSLVLNDRILSRRYFSCESFAENIKTMRVKVVHSMNAMALFRFLEFGLLFFILLPMSKK